MTDLRAAWEVDCVLRDILAGLGDCSAPARRLRYRCACRSAPRRIAPRVRVRAFHALARAPAAAPPDRHAHVRQAGSLMHRLSAACVRAPVGTLTLARTGLGDT